MKINPSDIKVPLIKKVEVKNNEVEVSLSKRSDEASKAYQEFVASYVFVNEASTQEEAESLFVKYEDIILEQSESAELTPAQKKLPPVIQKAILEKMKKKQSKAQDMEEKEMENEEEDEMEEEEEDCECEEGEAKKMCAKCESKASGQKTTFLNRNDIVPTNPTEIKVNK